MFKCYLNQFKGRFLRYWFCCYFILGYLPTKACISLVARFIYAKYSLLKLPDYYFWWNYSFYSEEKMKGFSLTSTVVRLIFCVHKLDGYLYLFYLSYTSFQYTYFLSSGASHMFLHVYFIWNAYSLNSGQLIPHYCEIQMFVALYFK